MAHAEGLDSQAHVAMVLSNDFAADPRVEKEAAALAGAGYRVTVVAWGRSGEEPSSEERGPIRIERVGPQAAYGSGLSNLSGFREFWRDATTTVAGLSPDVVHCHDLDTAPVARDAKTLLPDARFVLDLHEIYPESNMMPKRRGVRGIARGVAQRLERRALAAADLVVLANPGHEEVYASLVPADRRVVVGNYPDLGRYEVVPGSPSPDVLRTCFIGQKRFPEMLRVLMEAVQSDPRLHAYLGGGGSAAEEVERAAREYARIDVEGRLSYEEIPSRYDSCDVVYAVYPASLGNPRRVIPVKAFEGMACGLPVLAGIGTAAGRFVEAEGIGYAVNGEDRADVARVLIELADDPEKARAMGQRGRRLVEEEYNWASAASVLLDAYGRLTQQGSA